MRGMKRINDSFVIISLTLAILAGTSQVSWGGTALGDLAASMQPGTFATLTTNGLSTGTSGNCNSWITDEYSQTGACDSIISYGYNMVWDNVTRQVLYEGAPHVNWNRAIAYTDSTNTWRIFKDFNAPPTSVGHSYDHLAISRNRRLFFHRNEIGTNGNLVRYYNIDTGVWGELPRIPVDGYSTEFSSTLRYFPERDELLFIDIAGGAWRYVFSGSGAGGSWQQVATASWLNSNGLTSHDNMSDYSPVHKMIVATGGGNSAVLHYGLNGVLTKAPNAPISLGGRSAPIVVDPVSGNFLVFRNNVGGVCRGYEYDPSIPRWTQITFGNTAPYCNSTYPPDTEALPLTAIDTYGVIMFMNTNDKPPRVFLYKHLPSGPPPPPPPPDTSPPSVPTGLTATGMVSGVSLSWTASTDNVGVAGYRIYRNGSLVATSQATSYLDSGLSPQTTYTYSVSAYDAAGNVSALSAPVSATTPAAPPPSAPVAAYSFSEGTGTTGGDASGYGNTGTVSNTTWTTSGKYGSALVFNGSSARVTIPHSASLALTTGMTLEAWVYPTNVSAAWRDVIMKGSDEYYLEATSSSGPPAVAGSNLGGSLIGSAALPINTWSHLAGTYDGTTLRLYVNGVQVASRAQTGSIATTTNPLQIGGDSFFGQYFQGTIDEVRIYNRALTATEIQNDMNTPVTKGTLSPKPPSGIGIQ